MATKKFAGKESRKEEMSEAQAIKSGRMTPAQYASKEAIEERGMKNGGMVMGYANGGLIKAGPAPNVCEYNQGPGVRSQQDYRK